MAKFDSKTWNSNVFQKYYEKVPNVKENSLLKNGLLKPVNIRPDLRNQVGGALITEPIKGLLDGDVLNYDGETDIVATSRDTFEQKKVIIGRAKAWQERDFSTDLTGVDWMSGLASEVKEYFDSVDQEDILAELKGIFAMTDNGNDFVEKHTYEVDGDVDATTLNSALQKAAGDKKKQFSIAIMHSAIATNLENLQLLEYLKYTDSQGITRNLTLGQYNGKLVVVDDDMPTEEVEANGDTPAYTKYTTYVLGQGFFDYEDFGARVPNAMARDEAKFGGLDILYTRQRKMFAPKFISFTAANMKSNSPTPAELADGANWEVVNNGKTGKAKAYVNNKMIPLARIISRG